MTARPGSDAKLAATAAQRPSAHAGASEELGRLRREYLDHQIAALETRVRMLKGERLSFDEESRALYDAVAPTYPESHFKAILDQLERRFPGGGPLVERYDAWRRAFVIPRERLDTVFKAAIHACRGRTLAARQLPPTRNSASSTSRTNHGAATTGIREISGA